MNKAEKALERALAFRRTPHVKPDINVDMEVGGDRVYGFLVCNTTRVEAAWTTGTSHGFAKEEQGASIPWDDGAYHATSQKGVCLYSLKSDALRELRHRIEEEMLGVLVLVDMAIEEALQQEKRR